MKRVSILTLAALVVVFAFPNPAACQAPPGVITGGAMFKSGGHTSFVMQAGGNVNVMEKFAPDQRTVVGQVYTRLAITYADDYWLTGTEIASLKAFSGYIIGERWFGDFAIGTGIGMMMDASEESEITPPVILELAWRPHDAVRVGINGQYIPINDEGDLVVTGVTIGITP